MFAVSAEEHRADCLVVELILATDSTMSGDSAEEHHADWLVVEPILAADQRCLLMCRRTSCTGT